MSATARPEQITSHAAANPKAESSFRTVGPPSGRTPQTREDPLKEDLGPVIDRLELSDLQKSCLRARWLASVVWMDRKATHAQRYYYGLRLSIIIGGLIIPALVSRNLGSDPAAELLRWPTFVLSLLVAIAAAIDGFFRHGERWRHYRSIVERLKIEGWQFFQLSGPYSQHKAHAGAYTAFAARVEEVIQSDVQQYITEVVREKEATEQPRAQPAQPASPSDGRPQSAP